MRRHVVLACAAPLVLALLVASAHAQGGGRGGQGGPGGFGGPGGGFGGFGGGGATDILRRDDVRKELELVDDQIQQLEELFDSQRDKMRDLFSEVQNIDPEQRREKMAELFRKAAESVQQDIEKILLPHQVDRMKQLALQLRMRGSSVGVLMSDEVAKDLGISEAQKEKIRAASEQSEKELREKMAQLRKEAQEKLLATLTPQQRAKFNELVGEPFEFDMSQGFGGGAFGGGRRDAGDQGTAQPRQRRGRGNEQ